MTLFTWDMIPSLLCFFVLSSVCSGHAVNRENKSLVAVPLNIPRDTTELYLRENVITSLGGCEFCSLTALVTLDISKNGITEIQPTAFNGTQLSFLDLSENKLTTVPSAFGPIATTLLTLKLQRNKIQELSDMALVDLTNLETLHLYSNSLENKLGTTCFSGLHSLKELRIANNQLTDEVFSRISSLSFTLEYLGMNDNSFGPMTPEPFVKTMKAMKVLKTLTLKNTGLKTLPDFYRNNENFSLQFIDIKKQPSVL